MKGYLKPKHTAGTFPAKLRVYYRSDGKWKVYKDISAKAKDYSTYSKVYAYLNLPKGGRYWAIRFYHPADSRNAYSAGKAVTIYAK